MGRLAKNLFACPLGAKSAITSHSRKMADALKQEIARGACGLALALLLLRSVFLPFMLLMLHCLAREPKGPQPLHVLIHRFRLGALFRECSFGSIPARIVG